MRPAQPKGLKGGESVQRGVAAAKGKGAGDAGPGIPLRGGRRPQPKAQSQGGPPRPSDAHKKHTFKVEFCAGGRSRQKKTGGQSPGSSKPPLKQLAQKA